VRVRLLVCSQARHIGKVVVRNPVIAPLSTVSSASRTIISGGTGTLGTLLAGWLARWAVQHIVLASRSGRLGEAAAAQLLRPDSPAWGCCLTVTSCDLGATEEVAVLTRRTTLPVGCFMHAGGVLADAMLPKQSLAGLRAVHAPKGAALARWLEHSCGQPISSQMLFSSVAALLGAPGQANYSASNAALDAAAQQLQVQGMPVVSMQWGAWAGAGMAAQDAQTAARVERMGMALIQPQQGLAALEGVLGAAMLGRGLSPVVGATPIRLEHFLGRLPLVPPFFEVLAASVPASSGAQTRAGAPSTAVPHKAATAAPTMPVASAAAIQSQVGAAVAAVLGAPVAPDASLMEAGLDSLGAVELRNALAEAFRMELPATLTFDYPSVTAVAGFITDTLTVAGGGGEASAATAPARAMQPAAAAAAGAPLIALTGLSLRAARSASMQQLVRHMREGTELHTPAPFSR
jgi:acyl carrier protein